MKRIDVSTPKFPDTYVIVDDRNYDRVMAEGKWSAIEDGNCMYAKRTRPDTLMHRFILNAAKGEKVDHRNINGLDNREENLRMCTTSQNMANSRKHINSASKYKGVCPNKLQGGWYSTICCDGKRKRLGSFETQEEAARAYDKKAKELFGEFANLNFKN